MKVFKLLLPLFFFFSISAIAGDSDSCFPKKQNPPRLVNDFAGILTPQEEQTLEKKLLALNDSTSTQVAIVTVNSLCGYDQAGFTFKIGEEWGVGNNEFDNGVVLMVKPKVGNERGKTFIAPGYGLEGVLPDAICKRIVSNELVPHFKKNDYYGGIAAATEVIIDLAGGEYSAKDYGKSKKESRSFPFIPFFVILFFVIVMFAGTFSRANKYARKNNIGLWTALFLMGSMSGRHRGHYNNFTSGRGGFGGGFGGGGGGGFGGFGGGSFGGGGAGGSW